MTTPTSPDPTTAIPVSLPPTEVVVVVVEPDGTYTVGANTGAEQLPPARAVGILRAAAMQVARQHGVNGRDALEDELQNRPWTDPRPAAVSTLLDAARSLKKARAESDARRLRALAVVADGLATVLRDPGPKTDGFDLAAPSEAGQ